MVYIKKLSGFGERQRFMLISIGIFVLIGFIFIPILDFIFKFFLLIIIPLGIVFALLGMKYEVYLRDSKDEEVAI